MKIKNLSMTRRNPKEFDRLVSEYRSCGYFVEVRKRENRFIVWAKPPNRPRRRRRFEEQRAERGFTDD